MSHNYSLAPSIVANCPYFRGTVGCPSKDLRISIVVPPIDVGYNDHNIRKCIDLIIMEVPYTDVSLLLVLAGWQLCPRP
jgi:hypothetical protein